HPPDYVVSDLLAEGSLSSPRDGDIVHRKSDSLVLRPGKADGPNSSLVMLEAESFNVDRKIAIHLQEPIQPLLDLIGLGGICLKMDDPFSWFLIGPIDVRNEGSQRNADLPANGVRIAIDSLVVGNVDYLPRA